ncbi:MULTISPECIES: DUF4255 domain-containing protein [Nostoc]|uniref:DUF4255 domain-containing protein n=1 Tax=Nostoc paludosum FACHB-159 TaxID=2692908 RepID=A0ABR8KHT6_9NOSO|nr:MULTISPECIES: DUF4255 domain-containing protein [Nostoc]MBD2681274.1 DUF4255 domain-containing protein [Nostoc sp. FACHB-857]MBD2737753.1 DUF4255 domain-containing protein [Nostoc paludosum FACHB-159]
MSSTFAIATVTAVLKNVIENGLTTDPITANIGDVLVTAISPDRMAVEADERCQINLFLYQVMQNRNADWTSGELKQRITQSQREQHYTNPPLALDLQYLITVYGAKDFQTELLLGYVMQLFYDIPILTQDIIQTALHNTLTINTSGVLSPMLTATSVPVVAEQIAQIKIKPEFSNMEETSKLWSILQTQYRPSISYQASMVLIKSRNTI